MEQCPDGDHHKDKPEKVHSYQCLGNGEQIFRNRLECAEHDPGDLFPFLGRAVNVAFNYSADHLITSFIAADKP